ncbi:MAG: transketolase, partial [Mesorhizobium sp.]
DSIGLGEDGPTHQPVEHLAALRAIPNHNVFRPADAVETAECWQLAIEQEKTPSTLALTRQNLPTVRNDFVAENLSRQGAYELAAANGDAAVTIFSSGSEVEIALAAREALEKHGHPTRVVSVPCFELFDKQSADYRKKTIGNAPIKIAIEAGIRQGWDHFIGTDGIFIGMTGFGASGTIEQLYPHFGITAEATVKA